MYLASVSQCLPHICTYAFAKTSVSFAVWGIHPLVVIGIHEDRIQPSEKALPYPLAIPANSENVIGVRKNYLRAVSNRRICAVSMFPIGRYPVSGTG